MLSRKHRIQFSRSVRLAAIICVSSLLFASCSGCKSEKRTAEPKSPPKENELSIGVIAPMTGPWKQFGESIQRGAIVAASEINKLGGILGKQIRLEIVDSESDPDLANQLAIELIDERKVRVLIGTVSDEEAAAVIEVAAAKKIPFFYPSDGPLKTCKTGEPSAVSDVVWSTGYTPEMVIEPLLIHLSEAFRQKESNFRFTYFGTQTESSSDLTADLKRTAQGLGFENSQSLLPDPRIDDFYDQIQGLFKLGADVLFVTVAQQRIMLFMEQASKLSVRKDMALAGLYGFSEENTRRMQATAEGVITATRYLNSLDTPANREFLTRWKASFPGDQSLPTAIGVGSYSAVILAAKGFAKAGSDTLDLFQSAMKGLEVDLPQGKIIVDAKNHTLIQPLYAVEVKQGAFVLREFLGEVSHPGVDECLPLVANVQQKKRVVRVLKRADSIAETNRGEDRD